MSGIGRISSYGTGAKESMYIVECAESNEEDTVVRKREESTGRKSRSRRIRQTRAQAKKDERERYGKRSRPVKGQRLARWIYYRQ